MVTVVHVKLASVRPIASTQSALIDRSSDQFIYSAVVRGEISVTGITKSTIHECGKRQCFSSISGLSF